MHPRITLDNFKKNTNGAAECLQVLSAHFRAYIQALEKLQLDIATYNDLIGVETRSSGLFTRAREPLKNRSAVFALGDRINILKVRLCPEKRKSLLVILLFDH